MTPTSEYWATLAQVMPLIGFALVASARLVTKEWNEETPRAWRLWCVLTYGSSLAVIGIGELAALRALRGEEPSPVWIALCEQAIVFGIGIALFSPAVEIAVRAAPQWLAGLVMTGSNRKVRTLDRQITGYMAGHLRLLQERRHQLERMEGLIEDYVEMEANLQRGHHHFSALASSSPSLTTHAIAAWYEQELENIQERLRDMRRGVADGYVKLLAETIEASQRRRQYFDEMRGGRHRYGTRAAETAEELAAMFRSYQAPVP